MSNILKRRGLPPAPERQKTTTWTDFIHRHRDLLWATAFFSTEVWTLGGLVTFYVLFFIKLDTREVHIAGVTPHPSETWMKQVARNLTMEEWGILKPGQYLIHDRDAKFSAAFNQRLDEAGVKRRALPPKSPNLNAAAEPWIRSVKDEALSKLIWFGERSLCYVLIDHQRKWRQNLVGPPQLYSFSTLTWPTRADFGSSWGPPPVFPRADRWCRTSA